MSIIKSISKKLSEKYDNHKLRKESSPLSMAFFDSINFVPGERWDSLASDASLYLSRNYLGAVEDSMKKTIDFRYVMFFDGKMTVALASFQIVNIDEESLGIEDLNHPEQLKKIEGKILERIGLRLMISGTLFASGETGFYYDNSISDETAFQALAVAIYRVRRAEKLNGQIMGTMVKEYFPENHCKADFLERYDYREFFIDPNMVLDIDASWNTFNDYQAALVSRYRSRAKDAYKKSKALTAKSLKPDEIRDNLPIIRALFEAVHTKASFKLGLFNVAAFVELKEKLGDSFVLEAYFLEDRLVGFMSAYIFDNKLDANYVGLDYEHNTNHSIYQRILYDGIKLAIDRKVKRLYFGRTAGEMKSALGAGAVDMKCYMRTRDTISNKIFKPIFNFIEPPDYVQRFPFKGQE